MTGRVRFKPGQRGWTNILTTQLHRLAERGPALREQAAWEGRPTSDQRLTSLVDKGIKAKRMSWAKPWGCEPAWRIRGIAESSLWLVGVTTVWSSELRPLLIWGLLHLGGTHPLRPSPSLCARASGCSWRAPALASDCSKRRKRRGMGKPPSSMVSANDRSPPPWGPCPLTANPGHRGCLSWLCCVYRPFALFGFLRSELDITNSPDTSHGS